MASGETMIERLRRWLGGRRRTRTPEEKAALEERRTETRRFWPSGNVADPGIRSDKSG